MHLGINCLLTGIFFVRITVEPTEILQPFQLFLTSLFNDASILKAGFFIDC